MVIGQFGNIFGGQLFAANPRELGRIRADSAGVRQQFAADFFSEQWRLGLEDVVLLHGNW